MAARDIIIDTDVGQDDAVGLLLALASPEELNILGITTVAGNVPLPLAERNARIVCELAGRPEIKVFAGCDRPMKRPLHTAEHVHGKTGLDGAPIRQPEMPLQADHAVDFLIESLRAAAPGTVTICTMGPLTNIATALVRAPDIAGRIRQIVAMGGAYFEVGNYTPAAEFNIYVDPEGADIVFKSGVPLVIASLDVTHKVLTTDARVERIRALGTEVGETVADWIGFFERYDMTKYGSDGAPLHDPCVIAYLLRPNLFSGRECNVVVELDGGYTLGMTVADWWGVTDRPKNALFLGEVDADGYFDLLTERLGRL